MAIAFGYRALESQRSSGYKSTAHALFELIDNSIDAGSSIVKVILIEDRDIHNKIFIDEILVCDDGSGMSKDVLETCLQFGGGTNDDIDEIVSSNKLGKFGFGLPNASISQCTNVGVYSWENEDEVFHSYLNIRELKENSSIELPDVDEVDLPTKYIEIDAGFSQTSGTIISWKSCDRLSNSKAETIINKILELAGRIYRYKINDINISFLSYRINPDNRKLVQQIDSSIKPNDPLFLLSDTSISKTLFEASTRNPVITSEKHDPATYYNKFSINRDECKPTNIELEDHCYHYVFHWENKLYNFEIKTSVAHNSIQKPGIREGGRTKVGFFYGKQASLSFVRSDREISTGTFGGFYSRTDPKHRWWHVEVSFSADADDLLGVANDKQSIQFVNTESSDPNESFDQHFASLLQAKEQLWYELTKKIEAAIKSAKKYINNAHKEWELSNSGGTEEGGLPGESTETAQTHIETDGTRGNVFTDEEKQALFQRLKSKYPNIDNEEIHISIERYDKSDMKACILYSHSESFNLWSFEPVHDFLIITVNTNHKFYTNVISNLRSDNVTKELSAIELFLMSLALEESKLNNNDKVAVESFRSYVGMHLNRYMSNTSVEDLDD